MVNAGLSARKEVSVKKAVVTMGTVAEKAGMIVKKQLQTWLQLILTLASDGQVKLTKNGGNQWLFSGISFIFSISKFDLLEQ